MVEQIISKRVYFSGNGQARFLNEMINRIGRPCVAGLCGVDKRTFYDWRRGKYLITYDVVKKIVKRANAFMPLGITVLPEYWYVRKGAKRGAVKRNKLYGNPGTPEGCRKGSFIKACLRGLIDTDGGIYFHYHVTKGIKYKNIGLCFTNRSLPLLNSANQMFLMSGLSAKSDKIRHVSLYGISNLDKYMPIIGSNNIKNKKKIDFYKKTKI